MANPLFDETSTFGQPERMRATRQPGANLVRPGAPMAPDATRGEGTLTKYRPIGGWQAPEFPGANLVQGRLEAGEPMTAFRGGAGAPTPTGVIRGMHQTFATDTGGPQPQEFATPQEAGQASNRYQRGAFLVANPTNPNVTYPAGSSPEEQATAKFGAPVVPGQTLTATTAAHEGPEAAEERKLKGQWYQQQIDVGVQHAQTEKEAKNVTNFTKQWHNEYSPRDKAGKMTEPTDPNILQDRDQAAEVARTQGTEAGHKHYQQSLLARQYEPLFTTENLAALQGAPGNQNNPDLSPAALDFIKKNPQAKREYMLKYGPMLQQLRPPQPSQSLGQRLFMTTQETPGVAGP